MAQANRHFSTRAKRAHAHRQEKLKFSHHLKPAKQAGMNCAKGVNKGRGESAIQSKEMKMFQVPAAQSHPTTDAMPRAKVATQTPIRAKRATPIDPTYRAIRGHHAAYERMRAIGDASDHYDEDPRWERAIDRENAARRGLYEMAPLSLESASGLAAYLYSIECYHGIWNNEDLDAALCLMNRILAPRGSSGGSVSQECREVLALAAKFTADRKREVEKLRARKKTKKYQREEEARQRRIARQNSKRKREWEAERKKPEYQASMYDAVAKIVSGLPKKGRKEHLHAALGEFL